MCLSMWLAEDRGDCTLRRAFKRDGKKVNCAVRNYYAQEYFSGAPTSVVFANKSDFFA